MTHHEQQIKHGNTEYTQPTEHEQRRILDPEPNIIYVYPAVLAAVFLIVCGILFVIQFFF